MIEVRSSLQSLPFRILFYSKCQLHLAFLNSVRYSHSTQISWMLSFLTIKKHKLYLLILYHSSGSPASLRAALNAFLSANRITQLIHNGGSPVAGTEVRRSWMSWNFGPFAFWEKPSHLYIHVYVYIYIYIYIYIYTHTHTVYMFVFNQTHLLHL